MQGTAARKTGVYKLIAELIEFEARREDMMPIQHR